jgi:hypothetical protein
MFPSSLPQLLCRTRFGLGPRLQLLCALLSNGKRPSPLEATGSLFFSPRGVADFWCWMHCQLVSSLIATRQTLKSYRKQPVTRRCNIDSIRSLGPSILFGCSWRADTPPPHLLDA